MLKAIATAYSYDWLDRLSAESENDVNTTYSYDATGNLISKTTGDVTTNYVLNELDQVTSVTQGSVTLATYTYDLSGNRISKYSYGTTTTYQYDGQNNLISASNGSFTYDYTYDANGELLTKTKGNDVYKYYFDGVNLLFTKKNDSYNNRYIYADGAVFAAVGGAENFYWYSTDIRGSSSSILKSDSTANHGVKRIRDFSYDPYGDTTNAGHVYAEPEMDEIAYTGGVFDKDLGLYYLMSRYYDPMIAQFISEDSYRGDGKHFWNLYAYCNGDPINNDDRNGHWASGVKWKLSNKVLGISVKFQLSLDTSIYKTEAGKRKFRKDFINAIKSGIQKWTGPVIGRKGVTKIYVSAHHSKEKKGSLRIKGIRSSNPSAAIRVGYNNKNVLPLNSSHMDIRYLKNKGKVRTFSEIRDSVAHEFGHILGLSNAYANAKTGDKDKAIDSSIMRRNSDGPSHQDRNLVVDSFRQGQNFKGGYN